MNQGKVDPKLKKRIENIQNYIDMLLKRYTYVPGDVLKALYEKKMELVELI